MSLYTKYKANKNEEVHGLIFHKGKDIYFKLARAGGENKAYGRLLKKLTKPHRRAIQRETMDEEQVKEMMMDAFIGTCLKDWAGVKTPDGKALKFSESNAKKLFTDLPELYAELQEDAADAQNYLQGDREDDAKN